ncbi:MAG: hypothetical protein P1V20_08695 [Verrucomicrobiales bacterium]|nr:hypothetical protein [Verrucomicrobiales bacterium]
MKSCFFLIISSLLLASGASGQTLRTLFARQHDKVVSPIAMIEMMELQLNEQFKGTATDSARRATAKMIKDGHVMAFATIINGRDERFSYLLCPADAVEASLFIIQTQDGRLHRPVPDAPIEVLSQKDNLAIVRIQRIDDVISIKDSPSESSVGSFVGILTRAQNWKTGAITNSTRSAFNGIDPGTQRALHKHWARIGLRVNEKRSGYPEVIETDLNLDPAEAGSPLFDRAGNWHGVAIARADQHSTLVIPAKRVASLVAEFEIASHQ